MTNGSKCFRSGFGIMRFAEGEALKEIQEKARTEWKTGIKTAIFNNMDWQVSGVKEKVGDEVREVIWERILSDTGRLQKLLYKAQDVMPGEDTILKYFPRLQKPDPKNTPFVTMRVMLGNHTATLAQQTHGDQDQ